MSHARGLQAVEACERPGQRAGDTLVQVAIGILVVLLGSQAALWAEYGALNGQLSRIATQVDQIARAVAH